MKTGNEDYKYETIIKSDDPKTVKSFLYKSILELCYDSKDGLYYFSKFIVGDLKDVGYPKPFRFNTLLRKWDRLVKVHKKLAILCARGHGKCLSGETLISMANGTTKKLMNIKTNDEVISFNEKTMKLEKDHAIYPTYVGDKKIQQIKTKFGKKIDCASTHRFYTINGWKQTKDLKPGDYIAIPRISKNIYSSNTIPKELAYILGWLISEGRYNSSIGISQKNKEVLSYIKSICDKLKIKATIGKNEEKPDICISNKFFKNLSYFEELKGKNSYTKYIPQEIMQQSDEIKWHFLSSLFEGDGYLDSRRGKNMGISYSSMSEKLINDLHHLLLTININSKKYISIAPMVTKKYGKKMPVYNLKIVRSDIIIFLNNTFYISKNQQKQKILKYFNKTKRNTNIDIIPKFGIFTNKYIGDSKHFTKPSAEKYIEKKRIDFLNGFQKNGERYETLKEIYNSSDLKKLEILKNSDIFWDEIKIIETHETIPMYDMQVLKNNTYIANDIITHNSVFFSEIFTLYDMFLFKYRRSILISASQEQVNHLIDEIKSIVEANEWLITKKNDNRWASTTIGYNKGYIIGAGIGSEILGQHVDRIILDDVLRDDNKISDEEIEDFVDMKLDPMLLNRDGQMVIVGTPKRPKDIFSVIKYRKKENPKCPWEIVEYKAVIDYEKKILQCPDRFSWDDIMKKRLSMGPLKFAREYQLEFFSRDKSLFPTRIVDPAKKKGLGRVLEHKPSKRTPNWLYVAGVDCARSGSVSADYTVMIVLAYDSVKQTKQIVYMWREKGLKTTEQAKHIAAIAKKFDNCMCVVETNNMGQTLVDELVDTHNTFVEPLTVGGHAKKDELVRFLINSFENEQLVIPRGDDFSRIQMDVLEDELGKFCVTRTPAGNERFEGVGSHDDSLKEGTSIITESDMIKNIEDIEKGEFVLTHKGNYKKVISTTSKETEKTFINIKPYGGLSITLTDNHKIFVIEKPRKYYLYRNKVKLDIKEVNSQNIKKEKHLLLTPINREIKNINNIDLKDYIKSSGWMYDNNNIWHYRNKEKKYKRKIQIDKDFAFFIGHFAGDGCYSGNIAFNKKDMNLIKKIRTYLNKLGIICRDRKNNFGNAFALEFSCIPFQNFLKRHCKKRENKQIPDFCMKLSPILQKEIFEGYRCADGTYVRNMIITATISKKLAYQMRTILLRNNIIGNIRELKRHRYEKTNLNQFWIELNKNETSKYLYGKLYSKYELGRSFIFEDYLISTIYKIEKRNEIHNVYDLQVEDDVSFVAEGIAVHNCVDALCLANKGTQILGVPFAVTDFDKSGTIPGSDLSKTFDRDETDLVKLIKMGIIK